MNVDQIFFPMWITRAEKIRETQNVIHKKARESFLGSLPIISLILSKYKIMIRIRILVMIIKKKKRKFSKLCESLELV